MDDEKFSKIVTGVLMLVLFFPALMFSGWAISVQWQWFAVPMGAPSINWAQACGLDMILMLSLGSRGTRESDPDESAETKLGRFTAWCFLAPIFVLGVSWMFHVWAVVTP